MTLLLSFMQDWGFEPDRYISQAVVIPLSYTPFHRPPSMLVHSDNIIANITKQSQETLIKFLDYILQFYAWMTLLCHKVSFLVTVDIVYE